MQSASAVIIGNSEVRGVVIPLPGEETQAGGGNVTSVSSGDNCLFVSPTTGDVVVTFNTSCGSGGGAVDSVTSGDDFLFFNPTTGNVIGRLNTTTLNVTIDHRINSRGFLNSSVANQTYYLITNPSNFINITTGQFFNDTAFINSVNSSIWSYINANEPSWLSTFNATYNNILNQTCPAGNYSYGIQSNGTILCRSDMSGGGGDFFFANFTSSFNLNLTAVLPLANRTLPHCSNVTGQSTGVCPTSNVQFNQVTSSTNIIANDGQIVENRNTLGQHILIGFLGIPVATFTSEYADIRFKSLLAGFGTYLANNLNSCIYGADDDGTFSARCIKGVKTYSTNESTGYEILSWNRTLYDLDIPTQNINSTRINAPCQLGSEGCIANYTGWNITSNHQSYDITGITSLDTTYTNSQGRVIYLDITFESQTVSTTDNAYVTLYVNGSYYSREGVIAGKLGTSDPFVGYHHLGGYIQPGQVWSLNSTVSGTASVNLERVWMGVI